MTGKAINNDIQPVTKEELETLPALSRRLFQLNYNIENAHKGGYPVMDVVRGKEATSSRGRGKPIVIMGMGHDKLPEWEAEYYTKAEQYLDITHRLDILLNSLPEITPEQIDMKTILQYKYRDNLSHREIAKNMNYSKSAITDKINRFWEKSGRYGQNEDV